MTRETRPSPVEMPPGRSRTLAGIVVIAAACMPILGSTSIAPIQPAPIRPNTEPDESLVDRLAE